MEKEKFFLNTSSGLVPTFLNLNWDNSKYSMEQMDPFESALSSMVSSPAASNAGAPPPDGVVIRELIGRLGSICNSGEISSQSQTYMGGININSTNHSGYSTPLNSPPKVNLSMMDQQIRGNLTISENARHDFAPFSADPGFAERAAKYSCFGIGNQNFGGLELPYRSASMVESGMLSRVSSSQSLKALSQMGVSESKDMASQERSSTPEEAELSNGREESSVSAQLTTANEMSGRKRKAASKSKSKEKNPKASEDNDDSIAKRGKSSEGAITEKNATKAKVEQSGSQKQKDSCKPPEPPKDYIHVRARRGQATDSHSLAERVRREKISKRMKFLQDLVPGCNKVTGKAVMLDEIINYVQSLQRQVEFLSMKLATMNPSQDLNLEALLSKNIIQSREGSQQAGYSLDSSASGFSFSHQRLLGPIQSVVTNGSEVHSSDNQLSATLHRGLGVQFSSMDGFGDASSQLTNFWDDDLQSVIQLSFEQNQELAFPSQSFHGSLSTTHTKTEL